MIERPGYATARLLATACLMTSLLAPAATALPFAQIYIFGDSLSDTGNVYDATWHIYPPDPPYYQGRFSDSTVWVEYLADQLGLTVTANGGDPSQIRGNNFATGGARCAVDVPYFPFGSIPSLVHQVEAFIAGVAPLSADALFVVFCGSNDALAAANPDNDYTPAEQAALIQEAVDAISASITDLASNGARYFIVPNLLDWGESPDAIFVQSNSVEATASAMMFNDVLSTGLALLASEHDIIIYRLDLFSLHRSIINDAQHNNGAIYGITNLYIPIFQNYPDPPSEDPAASLFADDLHWSTAAHALLADHAMNAIRRSVVLFTDCAAGPLGQNPQPCELVDFDADGDVDLRDFAEFSMVGGSS